MELGPLIRGTLLRRYKRFLADVELADGSVITAHCPNTGAMTGCAEPGWPVWLSVSDSKTRKYPHTWELVETSAGLACIHSARANKVVREAFEQGLVPGFERYPELRTEVKYGEKSRVDLLLSARAPGEEPSEESGEQPGEPSRVYIEVKCVTLCRTGGAGQFPDAVSDRARKHLLNLQAVAQQNDTRAVLFFCVFHNGVNSVSAAGDIDPRYRDTLAQVMQLGVEVLAWKARVAPSEVVLDRPLPFSVDMQD